MRNQSRIPSTGAAYAGLDVNIDLRARTLASAAASDVATR